MSLPDYAIVGAMKCGTSTLAAQLGAQRGVFMTTPKEPNYFSDAAIFARGPDWYASLFQSSAPGDLKGEASTHYTKLPTYPGTVPRLLDAAPDVKVIYLIRDPLQRLVSHYIHEWTMGVVARTESLDAALVRLPELVEYGRYAMQIEPWLTALGPARVCIETLEALKTDPQAVLSRVGAFLGRDDLVWQDELEQQNASAERVRRSSLDRLLIDNPVSARVRRTLVPQSLRDRIKTRRRLAERPHLSPPDRLRLEAVFARDRDRLHSLFPNRPDLDLAYPFLSPA